MYGWVNRYKVSILFLVILLFSLTVRILFIAFYSPHPLAGGDGPAFLDFARHIAAGQGFRSDLEPWLADRPPLYSYFVAFVIMVFGQNLTAIFVAQAVLFSVSAGIFYYLAKEILGDGRGLIAALLYSALPNFLLFTKQTLTESIYIPLVIFFLASLILFKKRTILSFLFSGILLGMIGLVRREALLPSAGVILLFFFYVWKMPVKTVILPILAISLGCICVLIPWMLRNQSVLGQPVFSTSAGVNFLVGNNPESTGGYALPIDWGNQINSLTELARDQKAWELSLNWLKEDPMRFVRLIPLKIASLWGGSGNVLIDLVDIGLLPFYFLGIYRIIKKTWGYHEVLIIAASYSLIITLVAIVFTGMWRYRLVVYPGLIMLASLGMPEFILKFVSHRTPSQTPAV